MADANNQKQATFRRRIRFTSKGATYTSIFMSDIGDLYQQYVTTPGSTNPDDFIPNFKSLKPTLRYSVNSSAGSGVATVDSAEYFIGNTKLTFSDNGTCTTTGLSGKFKKVTGGLQIIDNIADVMNGVSFDIKCVLACGNDTIVDYAPVAISKYREGSGAVVTIAPNDKIGGNHNFTITDTVRQIGLKVLVQIGKASYDDKNYTTADGQTLWYQWSKLENGTWNVIAGNNTPLLTVGADNVNTNTHFKVEVRLGGSTGTLLGEDAQSVFDASDPLDVECDMVFSPDGTAASETSDFSEELNDAMNQAAYIKYKVRLMRDGVQVSETPTWGDLGVYNAAGLKIFQVPAGDTSAAPFYVVTVKNFLDGASAVGASPIGDFDIMADVVIP